MSEQALSYVCFDLETTSLDPMTGQILEIGAFKVENGVTVGKYHSMAKPDLPIPYSITEINGITNEEVADSPSEAEVLSEFYEWCGNYPFLGHNVFGFDYKYLKTRGKHYGLDFSNGGTRMGWDTLKIARKELPYIADHKLMTVRDHFGIKLDGKAHRADYDAIITKLIFDRFVSLGLVKEAVNIEAEISKPKFG